MVRIGHRSINRERLTSCDSYKDGDDDDRSEGAFGYGKCALGSSLRTSIVGVLGIVFAAVVSRVCRLPLLRKDEERQETGEQDSPKHDSGSAESQVEYRRMTVEPQSRVVVYVRINS